MMRITRLIWAGCSAFLAFSVAVVLNVLAPLFPRLEYAGWHAPSGQPPLDTARAAFRDHMITAENRKHQNGKKSLLLRDHGAGFFSSATAMLTGAIGLESTRQTSADVGGGGTMMNSPSGDFGQHKRANLDQGTKYPTGWQRSASG